MASLRERIRELVLRIEVGVSKVVITFSGKAFDGRTAFNFLSLPP